MFEHRRAEASAESSPSWGSWPLQRRWRQSRFQCRRRRPGVWREGQPAAQGWLECASCTHLVQNRPESEELALAAGVEVLNERSGVVLRASGERSAQVLPRWHARTETHPVAETDAVAVGSVGLGIKDDTEDDETDDSDNLDDGKLFGGVGESARRGGFAPRRLLTQNSHSP